MNIWISKKLIILPIFNGDSGSLVVLESMVTPFKVERSFWISASANTVRGGHRHFLTRQLLIAVSGSISVYLNNGLKEGVICLTKPEQGLLVEPEDWHTMTFNSNATLLVFASLPYDPADYIHQEY